MREQAETFGFNQHYLDDLGPQAPAASPRRPDPAADRPVRIGQFEVAATPLQMAMVAAGIANGGTVMRPYLVDEVQSPELDVLDKTEPEELSKAISAATADELTELMVSTVDQGTGTAGADPRHRRWPARPAPPRAAARRPPYAWFVSFAPANDPQVAVAVMIQKATSRAARSPAARWRGPIAKAVMEAVIQ